MEAKKSGWLLENDPEVPVLCPECKAVSPTGRVTPTEHLKEQNHTLTEWSR